MPPKVQEKPNNPEKTQQTQEKVKNAKAGNLKVGTAPRKDYNMEEDAEEATTISSKRSRDSSIHYRRNSQVSSSDSDSESANSEGDGDSTKS